MDASLVSSGTGSAVPRHAYHDAGLLLADVLAYEQPVTTWLSQISLSYTLPDRLCCPPLSGQAL
ncbi:hypothetical protein [Parasphingorhabdus sp.]|uniref:hypothetical protein n=1 Tax=Parasphingorhabdus sp. TaxID=2709688 RepID=UPI00300374DB